MRIDERRFPIDDEILWESVNSLAVDYHYFAMGSSLYSKAYGVITDYAETPEEDLRTAVLNACMRSALYETLFSAHAEAEKVLGHTLTSRYATERFTLHSPILKGMTELPAVRAMNVKKVWYTPDSSIVPITPYTETGLSWGRVDGIPVVTVPVSAMPNPNSGQLRRIDALGADTGALRIREDVYPTREGSNWKLQIAERNGNLTDGVNTISLVNFNMIQIEVPIPAGSPDNANFCLVYPDTNQVIPSLSKPVVTDTTLTFQVYLYALVDPAFRNETINLVAGQFYKLLTEVQLKYWVEEPASPVVYWHKDGVLQSVDTVSVTNTLTNQEMGLFHLVLDNFNNGYPRFYFDVNQLQVPSGTLDSLEVEISYVVDPNYLPSKYRAQIPSARNAILYKVAAELPVGDCGDGDANLFTFLEDARASYTKSYVTSGGGEVHHMKYGQRHGQVLFDTWLSNCLHFSRPIVFANI